MSIENVNKSIDAHESLLDRQYEAKQVKADEWSAKVDLMLEALVEDLTDNERVEALTETSLAEFIIIYDGVMHFTPKASFKDSLDQVVFEYWKEAKINELQTKDQGG